MDTHDIKGYSEYSNELDQGPTDKGSLVWLICCLLGAGNLFPWNAWITPYDYFTELYPKYPFEFAISLVFNYATVLFLFVGIKVGTSFSIKSRMMFGLLVDLFVLLIVPWIPYMGMDKFSAFMITLTLVFISGVATAVLFGTTLGVASIFPPKYITAVMVGNGVAGVVVGGIRIITKAAIPNDTNTSTIIYFMIAAFVILLNIFGYLALQKLPYAVYHMQKANVSDDKQPLLSVEKRPGEEISKMQVFKKIWKEALTVMFVFFISLGFFPGMTSLIKPKNENVMGSWFAVVMIALFQLFDFVGRSLPNFVILFSKRTLWIPCILRTVTVVLFLLCLKPFIFQSFWWPMIFMGIFAITNGYCGTLAMMYGPTDADTNEKETAGIIMSFFLNMGIFLGVHFALIFLLFH